jgi:hypothetical protein
MDMCTKDGAENYVRAWFEENLRSVPGWKLEHVLGYLVDTIVDLSSKDQDVKLMLEGRGLTIYVSSRRYHAIDVVHATERAVHIANVV